MEEIEKSCYASMLHRITVLCRRVHLFYLKKFDENAYAEIQSEKQGKKIFHQMMSRGTMDPEHKEYIKNILKTKKVSFPYSNCAYYRRKLFTFLAGDGVVILAQHYRLLYY